MRFITTTLACLAMLISFALPARAGTFDPHQVPADAQWVVCLDVDAFSASKLWAMVQKPLEPDPKYQMAIAQVANLTGIHFPKDLHSVTLYGRSADPNDAVVLIHADVDHKKIPALLTTVSATTLGQEGGRDIYAWTDKTDHVYGAFAKDDLAVIAHSRESLGEALATLDGRNPPLEANSVLIAGAKPGMIIYLAARDFASLGADAAMLKQVTNGSLGISEQGDQLVVSASATAANADTAHQLQASVEGIKALVALSTSDAKADANAKDLAQIVNSVTCKADNQTITAQVSIPLSLIDNKVGRSGLGIHFYPDKKTASIGVDVTGSVATQPAN